MKRVDTCVKLLDGAAPLFLWRMSLFSPNFGNPVNFLEGLSLFPNRVCTPKRLRLTFDCNLEISGMRFLQKRKQRGRQNAQQPDYFVMVKDLIKFRCLC